MSCDLAAFSVKLYYGLSVGCIVSYNYLFVFILAHGYGGILYCSIEKYMNIKE